VKKYTVYLLLLSTLFIFGIYPLTPPFVKSLSGFQVIGATCLLLSLLTGALACITAANEYGKPASLKDLNKGDEYRVVVCTRLDGKKHLFGVEHIKEKDRLLALLIDYEIPPQLAVPKTVFIVIRARAENDELIKGYVRLNITYVDLSKSTHLIAV